MIYVVLICLIAGSSLVAAAQRRPTGSNGLERVGRAMLVAGLLGLGFMLSRRS